MKSIRHSMLLSVALLGMVGLMACTTAPTNTSNPVVVVGTPAATGTAIAPGATSKQTLQQVACNLEANKQVLDALVPGAVPVAAGILAIVQPASAPADIVLAQQAAGVLEALNATLAADASTKCPTIIVNPSTVPQPGPLSTLLPISPSVLAVTPLPIATPTGQ